ncbi:hypothetical protein NDU88_000401 [Pleurodeles waltl]|uniref:Uncharacterized protein n=1 Tax=Pleurodeles waltl TaxID=8319 RepID=A0AAV7U5C4_PLEWA|nr:hypothetical protein NDU88_000401 [Pleurodeles waltl]
MKSGETVRDRCRLNKEDPVHCEPAGAPRESRSSGCTVQGGAVPWTQPPADSSRNTGGAAGSAGRCARAPLPGEVSACPLAPPMKSAAPEYDTHYTAFGGLRGD